MPHTEHSLFALFARHSDAHPTWLSDITPIPFIMAQVVHTPVPPDQEHLLIVRQQPEYAKVPNPKEKAKCPVDPVPIIEIIFTKQALPEDNHLNGPYFGLVEVVPLDPDQRSKVQQGSHGLVKGQTTSALHRIQFGQDGRDYGYFVFGDLVLQQPGEFILVFTLFEVRENSVEFDETSIRPNETHPYHVVKLSSIASNSFMSYMPGKCPSPSTRPTGQRESTSLTKSLSEAGIKLRLRKQSRKKRGDGTEWSQTFNGSLENYDFKTQPLSLGPVRPDQYPGNSQPTPPNTSYPSPPRNYGASTEPSMFAPVRSNPYESMTGYHQPRPGQYQSIPTRFPHSSPIGSNYPPTQSSSSTPFDTNQYSTRQAQYQVMPASDPVNYNRTQASEPSHLEDSERRGTAYYLPLPRSQNQSPQDSHNYLNDNSQGTFRSHSMPIRPAVLPLPSISAGPIHPVGRVANAHVANHTSTGPTLPPILASEGHSSRTLPVPAATLRNPSFHERNRSGERPENKRQRTNGNPERHLDRHDRFDGPRE